MFCAVVGGGLALAGLAWGAVLLVALPRGLGNLLLHSLWRPTYPLVLPLTISIAGGCVMAGAGTGLHALGAAHRSLRAMIIASVVYVACSLVGAALGGAAGTVDGAAVATWVGALAFWWHFRNALHNSEAYSTPTVPGAAPDTADLAAPSLGDTSLAEAGLLAETALAETGLAATGLASTGLAPAD
jgi:hypothetical protein